MKKITLLTTCVALLVLVLVATPAMAQNFDFDNDNGFFDNDNDNDDFDNFFFDNNDDNRFFDNNDNGFGSFDIEQETDETGDVDLNTEIVNTGDNSNQCVAPLQFGNTGNLQNAQGFTQLGSSSNDGFNNDFNNDGFNTSVGDVEFEGSSFEFNPEQNVECNQQVQQSAAASSW
jgi:hypothetical protein